MAIARALVRQPKVLLLDEVPSQAEKVAACLTACLLHLSVGTQRQDAQHQRGVCQISQCGGVHSRAHLVLAGKHHAKCEWSHRWRSTIDSQATSALDADSESIVQSAIDSMILTGGMTVLIIAHRLSTIRNASKIVVIAGGCTSESGTHDELLAMQGDYSSLVAKQMQLHVNAKTEAAAIK